MNSSEAAEQMVKFSIEGIEMLLRVSGTGAERIAVMLYTMSKDKQMTKGKTSLNKMLKSGSPLQIFSVKASELKKFEKEAKKYGILYTALIDKNLPDNDGIVDIMVRSEDASKVNRVVERFKLAQTDNITIRNEIEKDKMEEMMKEAKEKGIPVISDEEKLANDILAKPIQKEKSEVSNPEVAKTQKPLSEPNLENLKVQEGVIKENKPSVRKLLQRLKDEVKYRNVPKDYRETLKKGQEAVEIDVKHSIYDKPKDIKGRWYIGTTKTFKGKRKIYMSETLCNALINFKKRQDYIKKISGLNYNYYHIEDVVNEYGKKIEQRIVKSSLSDINSQKIELVFVKEDGTYVGTDLINYPFKIIHNELGITKCRFYDLRGSYATTILKNGTELRDVADILGHNNVETTENYYISSTNDSRKEATVIFDNVMNSDVINKIIKYEV